MSEVFFSLLELHKKFLERRNTTPDNRAKESLCQTSLSEVVSKLVLNESFSHSTIRVEIA